MKNWHCQPRAITNNCMWKRVTLLSASFYILNLCVLLVLRLFLVKYCFFNCLEETFKLFVNLLISPCQFLPTAENRCHHCTYMVDLYLWCFERVCDEINRRNNLQLYLFKYFIYTYVQFLLTKHACDKRLCYIVPCISENWWHRDTS